MRRGPSFRNLLTSTSIVALIATGAAPAYAAVACSPHNYTGSQSEITNTGTENCVYITGASVAATGGVSVSNTGKLTGPLTSTATSGAASIFVTSSTLTGSISNGGVIINAGADDFGPAQDPENAAIWVQGSTILAGGITNSGTITVSGSSANISGTNSTGIGIVGGSVSGGVTNSDKITVGATLTGQKGSIGAHAIGILIDASAFSGGVTNSAGGTISATASSTGYSGANKKFVNVNATGIAISSATSSGVILNAGSISATATAVGQGGAFKSPAGINQTIVAQAIGINDSSALANGAVGGILLDNASGAQISANASSSFGGSFGVAAGDHILSNGKLSSAASAAGVLLTNSTFAGSVVNAGSIKATATSTHTIGLVTSGTKTSTANHVTSIAKARGIDIHATSFLGGVANSGTVSAVATGNANLTFGTLAYTNGTFHTGASATGIHVHGAVSTFTGGITNSGSVLATANVVPTITFGGGSLATPTTAVVSNKFTAIARAAGISENASNFSGGIVNTGKIIGTANASTTVSGGNINSASILTQGVAQGIQIGGGQSSGGVSNGVGGTLLANANAELTGTFGAKIDPSTFTARATATGLAITAATFAGGVSNGGLISATATAGVTSSTPVFGTSNVFAVHATAVGINISSSSFLNGITNSGNIIGSAGSGFSLTFGTGTVAAPTSAVVSNNVTAVARAAGLVASGSSFSGGISNTGTIGGLAIATGALSAGSVNTGSVLLSAGSAGAVFSGAQYSGGLANAHGASIIGESFADLDGTLKGTLVTLTATVGATATGVLITSPSSFGGGISNAGLIEGEAQAGLTVAPGSGALMGTSNNFNISAKALGINEQSGNFLNGIANSGTVLAIADSGFSGLLGELGSSNGAPLNNSQLNTKATATGININSASFGGSFVNNSGGQILAFATVSSTMGLVSAGSTANHVHMVAKAAGLTLNSSQFAGGVTNAGTIVAEADANLNARFAAELLAGTATYKHGVFNVSATATGVTVNGTTLSGNVLNTGTIFAGAISTPSLTFTAGTNTATSNSIAASAKAKGLSVGEGQLINGVTNSGTIEAQAGAFISAGGSYLNTATLTAAASAVGADVGGTVFFDGFNNLGPDSKVEAVASAQITGGFNTTLTSSILSATAVATGVSITNTSRFVGGVSNAGTIGAVASGLIEFPGGIEGTGNAVTVTAHATGLNVGGDQYFGFVATGGNSIGVANTNTIGAMASAGFTGALGVGTNALTSSKFTTTAQATGIIAQASTFNGSIVNGSTGVVSAQASVGSSFNVATAATITSIATAKAIGVNVNSSNFNGGITNSGTIEALAAGSLVLTFGTLTATGSTFSNGTNGISATGVLLNSANFGGTATNNGAINSGTIIADASMQTDLTFLQTNLSKNAVSGNVISSSAKAVGLNSQSATLVGGIANSGSISAVATNTSTVSGGILSGSTVFVSAGATGVVGAGTLIQGGFNNATTGTITAGANAVIKLDTFTQLLKTDFVQASASAIGVTLSAASLAGGVANAGTISANANALISIPTAVNTGQTTSAQNITSIARARGLEENASSFTGGIVNSGSITAVASAGFTGGIGSGATLFKGGLLKTNATATGVSIGGTSFIGGVNNTGVISGTAIVAPSLTLTQGTSNVVTAIAQARGLVIGVNTFSGGINNSGTIAASAAASLSETFGTLAYILGTVTAKATATAATIGGSVVSGGVTNAGTISGTAMVTSLLTLNHGTTNAVNGTAHAFGATINANTFSGGITNSGTIAALAKSVLTAGFGTLAYTNGAFKSNVTAIGLNMTGTSASGGVTNTGLIEAQTQSQWTFNFGYTGTLLPVATNNFIGTNNAIGLRAAASNFTGGITNSGSIYAESYASILVTGGVVDNETMAISGGTVGATGGVISGNTVGDFNNATNGGVSGISSAQIGITAANVLSSTLSVKASATGLLLGTTTGGAASTPTFGGNVINNGAIGGFAIATVVAPAFVGTHNSITAAASARGLVVTSGNVTGNIVNAGTIEATAEAGFSGSFGNGTALLTTTTFHTNAAATALVANGSTFAGGILNSGGITGTAYAAQNITFNGSPVTTATATGNVVNATAKALGMNVGSTAFLGGVTNSGIISANATASFSASFGTQSFSGGSALLNATATGIYVAPTATSFGGGIVNTGSILGNATVSINLNVAPAGTQMNSITAVANAVGINLNASTVSGGVINNGSIVGNGLASVTILAVPGSLTIPNGSGGTTTVTTLGSIGAESVNLTANATGAAITGTQFLGGITNGPGAQIEANALARANVTAATTNSLSISLNAGAGALVVNVGTFTGGITNSGTILATAISAATITPIGTNSISSGTAADLAVAIHITGATSFTGGIINNGGLIGAIAHGSVNGTANVIGGAVATAILVDSGSAGPGTIFNSGTIEAIADGSAGTAISLFGATTPTTILQTAGLMIGSIFLSPNGIGTGTGAPGNGDVVIFEGGEFFGNITGTYGTSGKIGTTPVTFGNLSALTIDVGAGNNFVTGFNQGGQPEGFAEGAVPAFNLFTDPAPYTNPDGTLGDAKFGTPASGGTTINGVQTVQLESGLWFLSNQTTIGAPNTTNTPSVGTYIQSDGTTLAMIVSASGTASLGTGVTTTFTGAAGIDHPEIFVSTATIGTGETIEVAPLLGGNNYYHNRNLYPIISFATSTGSIGTIIETQTPFLTASIGTPSSTNDAFVVTLTRVPFNKISGLNTKETAFASYLENVYDSDYQAGCATDSRAQAICDVMLYNKAQYHRYVHAVDGEINLQGWQPLLDTWRNFQQSIVDRAAGADITPGAGMMEGNFNKNGFQIAMMGGSMADVGESMGSDSPAPADAPLAKPAAGDGTQRNAQGWGAWGHAYGQFITGDSTPQLGGFSATSGGVMAGADLQADDNSIVGFAVNYGHISADLDDGSGHSQQDHYLAAAYARYTEDQWYVDGVGGLGFDNYTDRRVVTSIAPFPTFGQAGTSYKGNNFSLYSEGGYTFEDTLDGNPLKLTPFVGAAYTYMHWDNHTEAGAGTADLSFQTKEAMSYNALVGGRFSTVYKWDDDTKIEPSAMLGVMHEFGDTAMAQQESFASSNVPGYFTVVGPKYSRDSGVVQLDVAGDVMAGAKAYLDYTGKISSDYRTHFISAGMRFNF